MFKPYFLAASLLALSAPASAQFTTDAKQAIIMDHASGLVLYEKDARRPMPPASMTKIMTAFMVFEALERGDIQEDTTFTVSEEAWRRGGIKSGSSTMFLDVNSEVPVIDLLRGVIIQSGNDACIVLAEGLAGSEDAFARRMTERARELGLESATFLNSTGWPHEDHKISAADLATLASELIERFPDYYGLYSERSFEWNGISQGNRNPLLGRFTGADGVKTGSTSVSGYGLVGSAERDGARRVIVINGLDSQRDRASAAVDIMEAAFRDFDVLNMYASGAELGDIDVYMGKSDTVGVVLREDVFASYERADGDEISARIDYQMPAAPIAEGDKVGDLIVMRSGQETARYPLYAAEKVARKGFFSRVGASILQKIRG
ncbi:D-alanyl-D-alanine carboxypeptidase family protein [uncultured Algimonas sp.]|uniref:D-alanyl-D-alanine carboxypeptidase family protein n=1 Tax=uncultured Algimonas sp. TaxID=1547920 RepID=UPI00262C0B38|nr:D-alanyl-D-alanine carboxypeptidase family protein [uncultured Algimonas sp.]